MVGLLVQTGPAALVEQTAVAAGTTVSPTSTTQNTWVRYC
jgi:hypothetical protein